jgi:hypothetical protein
MFDLLLIWISGDIFFELSTFNTELSTPQFTILSAQQLLAKASGLALKAKPIPRM